ncbi:MAG TPA: hypothetical protein VLI90_19325, partial [Tepidisphaeraceae bacterium]|nr:hypothetical protein [Tepidisphaeraceae bacterium]
MRDFLICLCLTAATLAVYWPVDRFGFVHFDDDRYVYENPHVLGGLTPENIAWAWRSPQIANYHPMTLMSYQLDATLFGARAGRYHVENVLLHILATLLLFNVWRAATGDTWPPAFVAAVFALHPAHVESVAWVSERKDVLSVLFMLLAMRSYIAFARAELEGPRRTVVYAGTMTAFALGLLAKSMIVTLPVLLLLMDDWPLRRLQRARWTSAITEKVPMLILSLAAGAMAMRAQRAAGVVADLAAVPLRYRLASSVVSYARYLGKTFWPTNLAPFYPYRSDWSPLQIGASL